jgi:hypothetical protein
VSRFEYTAEQLYGRLEQSVSAERDNEPDDRCSHCGCHPDDAAFYCPLQIGRWGVPCHGEKPR